MKNKKDKMSISMYFNYALLVIALILILMTKPDKKGEQHDEFQKIEEL